MTDLMSDAEIERLRGMQAAEDKVGLNLDALCAQARLANKQAEQVKALAKAGSNLIRMLMVNRPGLPDASKPTVQEFTAALDAWEKSLGLLNDGA